MTFASKYSSLTVKKDPDTWNIVKKQKMIISGSVSEHQNTVIDCNSREIPSNGRPSFEHNWNNNFISTSEVLQIELSECKIICIIFIQIRRPALLATTLKKNPNVEAASQIITDRFSYQQNENTHYTDQSYNNWLILVNTEWKYALLIDHITTDLFKPQLNENTHYWSII